MLHLQFRQINLLLRHALETVPYYRDRCQEWGIELAHATSPEEYCRRISILTRAEVQELGDKLLSAEVPKLHGKSGSVFTSGSTGMPIKVIKTELTETLWNAFTARDHLCHREPKLKLASSRPLSGNEANCPEGKVFENWGSMEALTFVTGESALLNIGTRIQDQVEWLQRFDPDYLLTYPGNCNL